MKKILAVLFCALMVFSAMPVAASAATEAENERDELLALACAVFPEHTDVIRNQEMPNVSCQTQSDGTIEVVTKETRAVSDDTELTYIEYSDRTAAIIKGKFTAERTSSSDQSELGGVVTTTCSFKVTCSTSSGVFTLSRVMYKMNANDYDYFLNAGSSSVNNYCSVLSNSYNQYETASSLATIVYKLRFNYGSTSGSSGNFNVTDFYIKVGNNGMEYGLYPYD